MGMKGLETVTAYHMTQRLHTFQGYHMLVYHELILLTTDVLAFQNKGLIKKHEPAGR